MGVTCAGSGSCERLQWRGDCGPQDPGAGGPRGPRREAVQQGERHRAPQHTPPQARRPWRRRGQRHSVAGIRAAAGRHPTGDPPVQRPPGKLVFRSSSQRRATRLPPSRMHVVSHSSPGCDPTSAGCPGPTVGHRAGDALIHATTGKPPCLFSLGCYCAKPAQAFSGMLAQ